jgi:hypothetical protein
MTTRRRGLTALHPWREVPMFRRLPTFLSLSFAATVGLFALTSVLTAQPPAQPEKPAAAPAPIDGTGIKRSQEENLKFFKKFSDDVLRLAQRWEKSDNPEDKERAKSLRAALKLIQEKGVEKLFKDLVEGLGQKNLTGGDFSQLIGKDEKLMAALSEILALLETEDELAALQRQIRDLKEAIEVINKIKKDQENLRARTDNNRGDPNKLSKDQKGITDRTQDAARALDKDNKDPKAGTPNGGDANKQEPKSENKAEAKPGDNAGDMKPDTKENKADTKGDGNGMGSPMGGDPKPSSPMGGDPKAGGDKPNSPMAGNPMAGDPKAGGEPKPNNPMDPKAGGAQKPMSGDSKAQGAGKGDSKPSAGQAGEGKPMGGDGMGGMGGMGQPNPGGSKGGQQGGAQQQQPQRKDPAAQQVQQAVPQQQGAQEDINKNDREEASKKQDKAIEALQKALEELEKRLKQLREKELAKLLANLEERIGRMLKMQQEVKAATEGIDKTVKALGGKPAVAEIQKSQAEADKEGQIIIEAEKTLKLMEGEGTAVVFAGVLKQVMGDMEAVQNRLNSTRVGADTQQIEQDIIDQLTMMKEALKKAKQDLENKPSDPKPNDPNAQQGKKKLIDLLNELKLVRSLQDQVNKRTVMHNKQDPGEQSRDPLVQFELKQLAERQKVLKEMLHKIDTQANQ